MNELLQKHGCSNVFTIPEGLRELMADISREVLRDQPVKVCEYIANYLSVLIITREHGVLAVKILEDLCDCRPTVSEHLMQLGMAKHQAQALAEVIKEEVESVAMVEGKEKVKECEILKKILHRVNLDEAATADVCLVARNAYKDYWYRKKLLEQNLKVNPRETWEMAALRTLELYKKTKPSLTELNRATQKIQAAYKGYYVRKKAVKSLKPKKKPRPKVDLQGPPADIAESREIDLGPVVDIQNVKVYNVEQMFVDEKAKQLNLGYDPARTLEYDPTTVVAGKSSTTSQKKKEKIPLRGATNIYRMEQQRVTMSLREKKSKDLEVRQVDSTEANAGSEISLVDDVPVPSVVSIATDEGDGKPAGYKKLSKSPITVANSDVVPSSKELYVLHSSQKVQNAAEVEIPEDINLADDMSDDTPMSVPSSINASIIDSELEDIADVSDNQDDSEVETTKKSYNKEKDVMM